MEAFHGPPNKRTYLSQANVEMAVESLYHEINYGFEPENERIHVDEWKILSIIGDSLISMSRFNREVIPPMTLYPNNENLKKYFQLTFRHMVVFLWTQSAAKLNYLRRISKTMGSAACSCLSLFILFTGGLTVAWSLLTTTVLNFLSLLIHVLNFNGVSISGRSSTMIVWRVEFSEVGKTGRLAPWESIIVNKKQGMQRESKVQKNRKRRRRIKDFIFSIIEGKVIMDLSFRSHRAVNIFKFIANDRTN